MESIASFSLTKGNHGYFVFVKNFRKERDEILIHFDPGAGFSMIGLNTITQNDREKEILKDIIIRRMSEESIKPYDYPVKTVTKEEVIIYPCRISDIEIGETHRDKFYFHLFLGDINNPLLGFDYSDDCYYIHRMGGDIEVIAVSDKAGEKNYPDKVLDFDKVLELFYKEIEN